MTLSVAESCVINLPFHVKIGPISSHLTAPKPKSLFLIDGYPFAELFSLALYRRINHIVWCVRACNLHLIFS